jgi:hypothetical protein
VQNQLARGQTSERPRGSGLRGSLREAQRPKIITAQQESLERGRAADERAAIEQELRAQGQEFSQDIQTQQLNLSKRRAKEERAFRERTEAESARRFEIGRGERGAAVEESARRFGITQEEREKDRGVATERFKKTFGLQKSTAEEAKRARGVQEGLQREQLTESKRARGVQEGLQKEQVEESKRRTGVQEGFQTRAEKRTVEATAEAKKDATINRLAALQGLTSNQIKNEIGQIQLRQAQAAEQGGQAVTGLRGLPAGGLGGIGGTRTTSGSRSRTTGAPNVGPNDSVLIQEAINETGLDQSVFVDDKGNYTLTGENFLKSRDNRDSTLQSALAAVQLETRDDRLQSINAELAVLDEDEDAARIETLNKEKAGIERHTKVQEAKAQQAAKKRADELLTDEGFASTLPDLARQVSMGLGTPEGLAASLKIVEDVLNEDNEVELSDETKIKTYDALGTAIADSEDVSLEQWLPEGAPISQEEIDADPEGYTEALRVANDRRIIEKTLEGGYSQGNADNAYRQIEKMFDITLPNNNPSQGGKLSKKSPNSFRHLIPEAVVLKHLRPQLEAAGVVSPRDPMSKVRTIYQTALLDDFKKKNFETDVNKARDHLNSDKNQLKRQVTRDRRAAKADELTQKKNAVLERMQKKFGGAKQRLVAEELGEQPGQGSNTAQQGADEISGAAADDAAADDAAAEEAQRGRILEDFKRAERRGRSRRF